jgi:hypothetical protein
VFAVAAVGFGIVLFFGNAIDFVTMGARHVDRFHRNSFAIYRFGGIVP